MADLSTILEVVLELLSRLLGAGDPDQRLEAEFAKLRPMTGKTLSQITSRVGRWEDSTSAPQGRVLYRWKVKHYKVDLLFEGDVCVGCADKSSMFRAF